MTVLVGDCREILRSLGAESVDCIITDPPYNQTSLPWDRWPTGWVSEARRVLKKSGAMWVFGTLRMFMQYSAEFSEMRLAQDVVWEKHNGSNPFADRFRRVHEQAAMFYRADAQWREVHKNPLYTHDAVARAVRRKNHPPQWGAVKESVFVSHDGGPRLMRSVMFCRSEHHRAVHPTQKPTEVVLPLIEYSCPEGGVVLDPMAGSGTTGVAAQRSGRQYVLIESDPKLARIAKDRLSEMSPALMSMLA